MRLLIGLFGFMLVVDRICWLYDWGMFRFVYILFWVLMLRLVIIFVFVLIIGSDWILIGIVLE